MSLVLFGLPGGPALLCDGKSFALHFSASLHVSQWDGFLRECTHEGEAAFP